MRWCGLYYSMLIGVSCSIFLVSWLLFALDLYMVKSREEIVWTDIETVEVCIFEYGTDFSVTSHRRKSGKSRSRWEMKMI
jgi:hypothetical protein